MCPHEFYLGTCTCIFKKIKPRGVGVGVECTCIKTFETIYCRNVPQDEKFSKFFWPKKNWPGGVLRERGLGTYTSPTLII